MPEAWITLTEDNLSLNSGEETAYRTALLRSGESDRLTQILSDVTYMIRSAIRSARSNRLDEDPETIPRSALFHAASLARYRLMSAFPGGVSEMRRKEYEEANQWLRDVAAGRYLIEAPGEANEDAAPPKARPRMTRPNLSQRREDARGS